MTGKMWPCEVDGMCQTLSQSMTMTFKFVCNSICLRFACKTLQEVMALSTMVPGLFHTNKSPLSHQ